MEAIKKAEVLVKVPQNVLEGSNKQNYEDRKEEMTQEEILRSYSLMRTY